MKSSKFPLSEKKLCIYFFKKNSDQILSLTYQLYQHNLIERWWALLELSNFDKEIFGPASFIGQILDDEEFLVTSLNCIILKINLFLNKNEMSELSIPYTVEKKVTQSILNELHIFFEKYSNDKRFLGSLSSTFRILNLLIHRMENFSDGKVNNCAVIEITPAVWSFLPLNEEDYSLFSLDSIWGELTLNYCLLGVPTAQAFTNQTIPRPQNCFSSGMYLNFSDDFVFNKHQELNSWLTKNNMDPNDPRCALGYIPLGILNQPNMPTSIDERIDFIMKFREFNSIKKIEFIGPKSCLNIEPSNHVPAELYNDK